VYPLEVLLSVITIKLTCEAVPWELSEQSLSGSSVTAGPSGVLRAVFTAALQGVETQGWHESQEIHRKLMTLLSTCMG
jgi:hypothetical protein